MVPETETRPASAQTAKRTASMPRSLWPAVSLVLLAAGASGYLGAHWVADDLRAEFALRPPVILFDMAGAVGGVASDQLASVFAREKKRAQRLADGGFLVLDAQAVIAAPPDLYIDTASSPDDPGGVPK